MPLAKDLRKGKISTFVDFGRTWKGFFTLCLPKAFHGTPAERRADRGKAALEFHGAETATEQALTGSRAALFAQPALVNVGMGVVISPLGRLCLVMAFQVRGEKILET